MKFNFSRSFPYLSSCYSKDPVIKEAIVKVPKDAGKSHAQEASSSHNLQPTNKSSRRYIPSWLPSCCPKDPVIKDAIVKGQKDAGRSHAQGASSSHNLQPTNRSRGTQEIQEELGSPFIEEGASANQDSGPDLEGKNSPTRQVHHTSDVQSSPRAEILYGSHDVENDVLRNLNLNEMTLKNNALSEEEYLSTTNDVALQHHPEHGVDAVLQRNSQNARAADRGRRALLNMVKADSSMKKATKALSTIYAGAASGLSHSAAALSNRISPYHMSMASGVSWATTAAFSGINHAIFSQKRDVVSLLSNAAHFGAGVASIVTTDLTYRSNLNQTNVNYAATSSNILWTAASALTAVSAIQNGRELPSEYGMSALAYTTTGLRLAAEMANVASAVVSIRSTATSNGNNPRLNKLSTGLWMTGTGLNTASSILSRVTVSK